MRVIIAAAGTGGHINPGIAIANKIMQEEKDSEIMFIGTDRGIENDLVPRAGYKLRTLEVYGLSKKLTLTNLKHLIKTIKSVKKAKQILVEYNPDVVIGTGGYICGPVLMAAQKLKIPTALHESNSFPGLAVKMLAKKTDVIMLGLEEAKKYLNKAKKVVLTGTPTKINNLQLDYTQKYFLKEKLELIPELPVLLVFGGSQGAKKINDAMIELIRNKANKEYQIVWAIGPKNYEEVKENLKQSNIDIDNLENIKAISYIYNMEEYMNIADLLVCRSGAITITEVAKLGKPAIFIPLPNVSQNHQEKNARVLEKIGAARIILNNELTEKNLTEEINKIINYKEKLEKMSKLANSIYINNVEDKIYKEIRQIYKK